MFKIAKYIVATMIVLFSSNSFAQDSLLHKILQNGVIRVGTTGDYPPFSYRDLKTDEFVGYDIDVAKQLANDLGVKLELVQTTWETLSAGLQADKYDVAIGGFTLTLDRMKSVAFSDGYFEPTVLAIILDKDKEKFKTLKDLDQSNVTIGVQAGLSGEETAKRFFKKAKLVKIIAPAIDYQELLAKRIDATITDNVFLAKVISQYKEIVAVDPEHPLEGNTNGIMTIQGDQVWLNWLNAFVLVHKQDYFFNKLNEKWINNQP